MCCIDTKALTLIDLCANIGQMLKLHTSQIAFNPPPLGRFFHKYGPIIWLQIVHLTAA